MIIGDSELWNNLTVLQGAAVVSALILTIGAVIEYWEKIKHLTRLTLKWLLQRATPFELCALRKISAHSLGPILVVLGIAGEVVFEGRTFIVEDRQEEQSRQRVGELELKASANEREASRLEKEAEGLREQAEGLREQAEAEHLARVKIEAKVAWRSLTEQQKNDIGVSLSRFSNQAVSFWYGVGDIEASEFIADIAEAVSRAKTLRVYAPASMIKVQEGGPANLGKPIKRLESGVLVQHTKDSKSIALAEAIVKELTVRGFDAATQDHALNPAEVPTQVWVQVEPRPNGPQGEYKLQSRAGRQEPKQ